MANLRELTERIGANETAVVEMALAFYRQAYQAARLEAGAGASVQEATRAIATEKAHKRRKRQK